MANYIGDSVAVQATVTDASGTLVTPSSITVVVLDPTGTTVTVSTPAALSTGVYQAIVTAVTKPGVYSVKWETTVSGFTKGIVYEFSVRDGVPPIVLASPDDVAARWRPLTAAEKASAEAYIADASAYLRTQYPGIDSQITTGAVDAGVVTSVVANMVKRAMLGMANGGAAQQSQTAGPYSVSMTYSNPSGNLYITAFEDQMIRGYQPAGVSKYFGNTTVRRTPAVSDFESWYDGGITIVGS